MSRTLAICIPICMIVVIFSIYNYNRLMSHSNNSVNYECSLPVIDPWHWDVLPYLNPNEDPMRDCVPSRYVLTTLTNGKLIVSNRSLLALGETRYRCLYLIDDYNMRYGDWIKLINNDPHGNRPDCDVVEVRTIGINGNVTYRHLHTQIYINKSWIDVKRDKTYRPNVFILILDSTSSSQAIRSLKKTMRRLKVDYEAVHFRYLNKVGTNSRPNAHGLLLGTRLSPIGRNVYGLNAMKPSEQPNSCYEYLDANRFVGEHFRNSGYVSFSADDWALGAFNWPYCRGFKKRTITHDMRPFQLRIDSDADKYYNRELSLTLTKALCKEWHEYLIDYAKAFMNAYEHTPKWSIVWLSYLAHNSVNGLNHVDNYFDAFFYENEHMFADSFVIMMGDHGYRFGGIRTTNAGRIEDNNPLLIMTVPKTLRRNNELMTHLRLNSQQLVSHYDIYATMIDIARVAPKSNWTDFNFYDFEAITGNRRGASLLRRLPLAQERNCETMEIPFEYCICQLNATRISNFTKIADAAARFLTDKLNAEISDLSRKCATLTLSHVYRADIVRYRMKSMYNIQFVVRPSNGLFKAIVEPIENGFALMSESIVRLNDHGKQGNCVAKYSRLQLICYCK